MCTNEFYNTLFDLDKVMTTKDELVQRQCSEPRVDDQMLKCLWHTNAAEESVSNASESATNTDPVYCTITDDVKPHEKTLSFPSSQISSDV